MTVPATRDAIVAAAVRTLADLEHAVHAVPPADRDAPLPGENRDRDLRDILNHLHAWHVLLVGWLDDDAAGRAPAYPADGYDWASLDALNLALRDRYRDVDLDAARDRLRASHTAVLDRVQRLDDADLFDVTRHPWLDGPLAEPVHECLGGHYEWALEAIGGARTAR